MRNALHAIMRYSRSAPASRGPSRARGIALALAAGAMLAATALPMPPADARAQSGSAAPAGAPAQETAASDPSEAPQAPLLDRPLRIGTATLAPYSWAREGVQPYGPAIWLMEQVSRSLGLQAQVRAYDLDGLYEALKSGEIDIAATGLPIEVPAGEPYQFSQPWDSSGFSVALRLNPTHRIGSTVRFLLSSELLAWFGVLFAAMLLFGAMVWALERKANPAHFSGRGGVLEGVWWSIVTMATVGYGDRVPLTVPGRVVAGTWMIIALVLVTIIAGVLSASLTAARVAGYITAGRDLHTVRVGIVEERADMDVARMLGIAPITFESATEAMHALEAHEIDAFVYPTTALRALVRESRDPALTVLPDEVARGFVAFGISKDLPDSVHRAINNQIVRSIASPEWLMQSRMLGDGGSP